MSKLNDKLIDIIKEVVKNKYQNEEYLNFVMVEIPKDNKFGDYSTNIAMRLAKFLHSSPFDIATSLKDDFLKFDLIEKVEVVKPGFINFYLKKEEISNVIHSILEEQENYGKSELNPSYKVMVEYVSANPTGDLHLGHARGAAYGDALTRIMKFAGVDVLREYYVNDAGNQIETLAKSLFERYKEALNLPFDLEKIGYQGKDVKILASKIKDEMGDKLLKIDEKEALDYFKKEGTKLELDKIKKDLDLYRVSFDHYQSELELYQSGKVLSSLNKIKESPFSYESEGALWLKTTKFKDDKDRVLIKSDGSYTYLTPDIAYHKDKFDRGYNHLIDILGADHYGYKARLKASLKILGYNDEELEILFIQMVRLMDNGEEVKMSKRTGNAITIRELCEDVGVDVARYFFLSKPIESQLDFDLNLARKASSDNPAYYIQYAYARMNSILSKRSDFELKETYPLLKEEKEILLLKHLDSFKKEIDDIKKSKEVNKLCNYAYKLASIFHSYYNDSTIIDENNIALTKERLALVKASSIVLKINLNLLGIEPKEKM